MSKVVGMGRSFSAVLLSWLFAIALSACGGGGAGNAGSSVFTPGTGASGSTGGSAALASLSVALDKSSVPNTGKETVTVTVSALDANRATLGDVPIKFAVDNGAIVTPGGTSTSAQTGQLTASVQIGTDHSNRTVSVTATSGSISQKVSFDVVDNVAVVTGKPVVDVAMTLDKSTVPNNGSETIRATATSLDATRSAVGGAPVSFSVADPAGSAFVMADSGKTTTDAASGQLTAVVSLGSNKTNRTITLTATSGTVVRSVSFDVVDALVNTPKATDLSLLLDKNNIGNSGTETVNVTVTAVDAARNAISGIPVTFTVDSKAVIQVSNSLTDASGQSKAKVQIGDDKSNRLITVTAKSDTLVRTASFLVTGAKLQGTALPALPAADSTGNKVEYRLTDVNQNPMAGVTVTVSAPGLIGASGVTDANGAYVYTYTAPHATGSIDITATAGGATTVQTVTVPSGTSTVPPAVGPVVSSSLSASPNVVRVNATADTSNRTEIRALFLGASNAPVKNIRVRFDLNGDANSIGGTLSSGNSLVYSDAVGAAATSYFPGTRASPTNGVVVRACWDYNDFATSACPNAVLTTLTVVSDPLSITIGTNELIEEGTSSLTYVKKYALQVVDAAGNPKSDVQITPSIDLLAYVKGRYAWSKADSKWLLGVDDLDTANLFNWPLAAGQYPPQCQNEDVNRNGSIDGSEDINNNGQLDPRKSDVSISMVGSTKTDANGTAILKIEYPKSLATWVVYRISAAAFGVLSPPATFDGLLPFIGSAITSESVAPAFVRSPYGSFGVINDINGRSCRSRD